MTVNKKRNSQKKTKGGTGAADYVLKVIGPVDQQTRGPDGSIALSNAQAAISAKTGGAKKSKKGGKGVLTNIAVPAVLLYTSNVANSLTKSNSKSFKNKKYKNKTRRSKK